MIQETKAADKIQLVALSLVDSRQIDTETLKLESTKGPLAQIFRLVARLSHFVSLCVRQQLH